MPVEADVKGLRGVRPAGPPPRPSAEPIRVQRRASNTGVIMVVGQKIALGRSCKHQTVTVLVSETTLTVELGDGDARGHPPDNHIAGGYARGDSQSVLPLSTSQMWAS